jgi:hypothetical protein
MREPIAALIDTMAQHLKRINPQVDPLALLAASAETMGGPDTASVEDVFVGAQQLAHILRGGVCHDDCH